MKKTLSLILCALMIMTVAILPISAAGKADWVLGNGFLIDNKNAPVTVKEVSDGVQFTWGGYYTDGVNWGGFASKDKLALDGLKVELRFDKVNLAGSSIFSSSFLRLLVLRPLDLTLTYSMVPPGSPGLDHHHQRSQACSLRDFSASIIP